MSSDDASLEELKDSADALELRRGLFRLRFAPALESQYVAAHLNRVRLRVRLWLSMGAILSLVYSVVHAEGDGIFSAGFAMEFLVVFPCALVLAWLAWHERHYRRFYMRVAPALVTVKGACAAFFIAQLIGKGYDEEVGLLAIYVISAFFFCGLMVRPALLAAATIVVVFALRILELGPDNSLAWKCFAVLLVTALMGSIVYLDMERSYRRSFLESAIIRELVTRDGLTGLMNRRALDEHLPRVWLQAQRDRRTLALLMIDIDHFKSYNDSYGHQAGDVALREVGRVLKEFTRRPLDIAARYGGEEFTVIFYDMPLRDVQDIAERIRKAVEQSAPSGQPSEVRGITISIGIGMVAPTVGRTLQSALQFADEALYRAKAAGRNCIAVNSQEDYLKVRTGTFRAPPSCANAS